MGFTIESWDSWKAYQYTLWVTHTVEIVNLTKNYYYYWHYYYLSLYNQKKNLSVLLPLERNITNGC